MSDTWNMTAEQASERLAELATAHRATTAPTAEATQTVEQLLAQQDAAAAQQDATRLTDHLTATGLSPSSPVGAEVQQFITGQKSISRELRTEVEGKIAGWQNDREFQRRLFAGDAEAKRLLTIACAMMLSPVEEGKP